MSGIDEQPLFYVCPRCKIDGINNSYWSLYNSDVAGGGAYYNNLIWFDRTLNFNVCAVTGEEKATHVLMSFRGRNSELSPTEQFLSYVLRVTAIRCPDNHSFFKGTEEFERILASVKMSAKSEGVKYE